MSEGEQLRMYFLSSSSGNTIRTVCFNFEILVNGALLNEVLFIILRTIEVCLGEFWSGVEGSALREVDPSEAVQAAKERK